MPDGPMAYCPRCHKDIDARATICPHCGYDFSASATSEPQRRGFAYSGMATLALIVGQVVAGLACIMSVIGCMLAALRGGWLQAFVFGPIGALLMLAFMVVFARILDVR